MGIRKFVQKTVRGRGTDVAASVNAVIAANVNEPGPSHTRVTSRQRVVHRSGQTKVDEEKRTSSTG